MARNCDHFSQRTKTELALRVGYHYSKCKCPTICTKKPAVTRAKSTLLFLRAGYCQSLNHSHSIIYGIHNQLTGNNFLKSNFHRTVLYTVTGNH